jgi:type VI secretion system protein VasG
MRTEKEAELASLKARWDEEKSQVDAIRGLRGRIEAAHAAIPGTDAAAASAGEDLGALRADWPSRTAALSIAGRDAADAGAVDASIVGEISGWTGVPVGKMLRDQLSIVAAGDLLGARVIGGTRASRPSAAACTSAAKIEDPSRRASSCSSDRRSGQDRDGAGMSDLLFGGEHNIITISWASWGAHRLPLKGSPPGYVGYGEAGC